MKRILKLVATVLSVALMFSPTPAQSATLSCAEGCAINCDEELIGPGCQEAAGIGCWPTQCGGYCQGGYYFVCAIE